MLFAEFLMSEWFIAGGGSPSDIFFGEWFFLTPECRDIMGIHHPILSCRISQFLTFLNGGSEGLQTPCTEFRPMLAASGGRGNKQQHATT